MYFEGKTGQFGAMTFGSLQLKPGMSPHPPHQHPEEDTEKTPLLFDYMKWKA